MSDILIIHTTDGYYTHHEFHQDFHNHIASMYTLKEAKTVDESLAAFDTPVKPKVVLLVDSGICDKDYAIVIKKVSSYAKQGGTVIMCLNFSRALKAPSTKSIFQREFGLTWKLGAYMRQDFSLNDMFSDVFKTPLFTTYNVKAQHISRASEHCQLYIVNDPVKLESPVIFERYTEKGFIGYIGDSNNAIDSQAILLAMLDKAVNKTELTCPEPIKVNGVRTTAGLASPDPQSAPSTTSQSDIIEPTALATDQPMQSNSSKANKKKKKKKKSKAQKNQSSHPETNNGSGPQDTQSTQQSARGHASPFAAAAGLGFDLGNKPLFGSHLDLSTMTLSPTTPLNGNTSRSATSNSPSASLQAIFNGSLNLFEGQSQAEIYRRIIDLYRLRCDDECVWDGKRVGIYAENREAGLPISHFESYLAKAQRCPINYLPSWWNEKAKEECIRIASDPNGKTYLGTRVAKADIQKAYADSSMPMLMRMIGEKIFGSRIGG